MLNTLNSLLYYLLLHITYYLGLPDIQGKRIHLQYRKHRIHGFNQEHSLEEEMAIHSRILAWKIPQMEEPEGATVHGVAKS